MIRRSGKAPADHVRFRPPDPGGSLDQAAALAPMGTSEMVFRICEAIW
jgi:hypothetical protein